jgi:hypothetical protein
MVRVDLYTSNCQAMPEKRSSIQIVRALAEKCITSIDRAANATGPLGKPPCCACCEGLQL